MPFDFLKRKSPETKKTKDAEPAKRPATPGGEGFESQSDALKPKDDHGKKGGLAGALASIRERVDKSSLGRALGTDGWFKNQWQGVDDAIRMNSFKHTMAHYREPFREFCAKEWALENLECFEAVSEGKIAGRSVGPQEIYETFFKLKAPREVNVNQAVLQDLHALAAKGEYDKMDFELFRKPGGPIQSNLIDTFTRFRYSEDLKKWLFHKMTGMKSPDKVGGDQGQ